MASEDCENLRFSVTKKRSVTKKSFKKRVMKATIISWLIDSGMFQENVEVFALDEMSKKIKNRGRIRREGILCLCCNKVFSVEKFHLHGGRINWGDKPYESVFVAQTKASLFSYMIEAWNKPQEVECRKFNGVETKGKATDLYDDACMICADGGDLMCCEKCNSTYHQVCMDMEVIVTIINLILICFFNLNIARRLVYFF